MDLKELLKDLMNPIKSAVLQESASPEDTVKAINDAWATKIDEIEAISEGIINKRVSERLDEAKAELDKEIKADFGELTKVLGDRVDAYLKEAYESFIKEYKSKIVSDSKVELVENFVGKFKELFNENNIEVDMESKNHVDVLNAKAVELEAKLDESKLEVIELKGKLKANAYQMTLESVKREMGLSETQTASLKLMSESYPANEKLEQKMLFLAKTLKESDEAEGKGDETPLNEDTENTASIKDDGSDNKEPSTENTVADPIRALFA